MKQAFEPSNTNIQSLADRFEISDLLLDVAAAIDSNDDAALKKVFAATVAIDESMANTSRSQHQIFNADIQIDGDTAIARTLCHQAGKPAAQVIYHVDELHRTEQGWRIFARSMQALSDA